MFFETLALINAVDHELNNLPSQQKAHAAQVEVVVHEEKQYDGRNELAKLIQQMEYKECTDKAVIDQTRTKWAQLLFADSVHIIEAALAAAETEVAA